MVELESHPTVMMVEPYSLQEIQVDELIAPLVLALWRRGVRTLSSCQADYAKAHQECPPEADGWAWLMLAGERDAVRLVRLAGQSWVAHTGARSWCGQAPVRSASTWLWRSRPPTDIDGVWSLPTSLWMPTGHVSSFTTHLGQWPYC